jgi:hypothetical protein
MSKIYRMVATTAMAVSAATLIAMSGPAAAATSAPPRAGYCLSYDEGGTDCSLMSKAQCEATASGRAAECDRDVFPDQGTFRW